MSPSTGDGIRSLNWRLMEDYSADVLQRVFELSPLGIAVVAPDLTVMAVNPAFARVCTLPADEIVGRHLTKRIHPDDWPAEVAEFDHLAHGEHTAPPSEKRLLRGDGTPVPVRITASAVHDHNAQVVGFVLMVEDISGTRAAESALRHSEQRYRQLLETTTEGFVRIDDEGTIVETNEAFSLLLGVTAQELPGQRFTDFLYNSYSESLDDQTLRLNPSQHRVFDLCFRRADGSLRFTRAHTAALYDAHGRNCGAYALIDDLTELKQRETALARSEARMRAIVETAVDAIITIDTSGTVLALNPAGCRLLGYSCEELVGRNIQCIVPEPHRSQHNAYLARYLNTHERRMIGRATEVVVQRKDKSILPAVLTLSEIDLPHFHVFVGILRDITPQKEAERALIAAKEASDISNRSKSAFLSNISHELRTPLNAILGFADILTTPLGDSTDTGDTPIYAQEIRSAGDLLLANINDLLEMATIEAGRADLLIDLVDLYEVVETCLRMVRKRAEQAHVQVVSQIAANLPPITADGGALKQMLLHQLSNAIKFTPEGGRIGVAARREDAGTVSLEVFDTGIGIPAARLETVVQPFVQAEESTTRRFEGIGLGLSISKRLAELHGGHLVITSQEGKGTHVTVLLPVTTTAAPTK